MSGCLLANLDCNIAHASILSSGGYVYTVVTLPKTSFSAGNPRLANAFEVTSLLVCPCTIVHSFNKSNTDISNLVYSDLYSFGVPVYFASVYFEGGTFITRIWPLVHTGLCKELALVWLNGPSIFFALDNPHLTIRGSSFLGLMCFSSSLLSSKVNLLLIFYLWIGACLLSCRIMLQSWGMYPLWLVIFQDSCPGYRNHNSRSEVFWISHLRWLQAFDDSGLEQRGE